MRIGSNGLKWLRMLHILAASIWFGCTVAILAMFSTCLSPFNAEAFSSIAPLAQHVFEVTIGPASIVILIEGFIYGFITHWGFFKHIWVLLKWILGIAVAVCSVIGFFNQMETIMDKINTPGYTASPGDGSMLMFYTVLQIVILVIMIIISVLKPWMKKSAGKKAA